MSLSVLLVLFLALFGVYALAMSRCAAEITPAQQRRHLAFFTIGLAAAFVIFIPSPELFGPDYRFSTNMGQMLLAADLAPTFLLLGIPAAMLSGLKRWESLGRRLTSPLVMGIVGTVIVLGWFTPPLFEVASQNLPIWLFKMALFLIAGFATWWPVVGSLTAWKPIYPIQLLYLFAMRVPMAILGAFLTFAEGLIYTARSFALEICAPSSITDQQIGGLLMWVVGGLIVLAAFTVVFFRWFGSDEEAVETPVK